VEREKTHVDYGYEIDLIVKPESSVPLFNREFAAFTGSGIPLFSIGGGASRQALSMILAGFHANRGYYVVETPIIASSELFKVSGHLQYYRKNMFVFDIEGHDFVVKPMNCPYHILLFLNHVARSRGKTPIPFKVY
jgi:threonyl-tRNA synthetase